MGFIRKLLIGKKTQKMNKNWYKRAIRDASNNNNIDHDLSEVPSLLKEDSDAFFVN